MLRLLTLLGVIWGFLLASAAQAAMIDLTDGSWSQFNNQTSATRSFGGNHVTLSTGGTGRLRFTKYDGGTSPACSTLACVKDGVGVNDDEISYGKGSLSQVEHITATFSNPVNLNQVQFLDLFGAGHPGDPAAEGAGMLIEFASGGKTTLSAFGSDLGHAGYLDYLVGLSNILSITFFANPDDPSLATNSDFALAGLDWEWAADDPPTGSGANNDPPSLVSLTSFTILGNDPVAPDALLPPEAAQSIPVPGVPWLILLGLFLIGFSNAQVLCVPKLFR